MRKNQVDNIKLTGASGIRCSSKLGVSGVGASAARPFVLSKPQFRFRTHWYPEKAIPFNPAVVRVDPIRFTTVSSFHKGFPFQVRLMKEKSRCSTRFHLLVPGG